MSALIFLLVIVNFAISWFNAWSVGRSWVETKIVGGLARFMAWCGATMSACGFTWCYLVIICAGLSCIHGKYRVPTKYIEAIMNLGYLAIILPVLGSGLAITIQSWAYFWKEKNITNGAVAGWNTFADVSNMISAAHDIPEAFSSLGKLFDKKDDDDDGGGLLVLVIILVVCALVGGVLTTRAIIQSTARKVAWEHRASINTHTREHSLAE